MNESFETSQEVKTVVARKRTACRSVDPIQFQYSRILASMLIVFGILCVAKFTISADYRYLASNIKNAIHRGFWEMLVVELYDIVDGLTTAAFGIAILRSPQYFLRLMVLMTFIVSANGVISWYAHVGWVPEVVASAESISEFLWRQWDSAGYLTACIAILMSQRRIHDGGRIVFPVCSDCGGALRDLNEPRCPECGQVYTLDEFHAL